MDHIGQKYCMVTAFNELMFLLNPEVIFVTCMSSQNVYNMKEKHKNRSHSVLFVEGLIQI